MLNDSVRDRRLFLKSAAAMSAIATAEKWKVSKSVYAQESSSANAQVRVGVMGVNSRGTDLAKGFAKQPNTTVAYVCDVDPRAAERVASYLSDNHSTKPQIVTDFRRILDDKSVDILVVAAPNHWHAPATILGCSAGKHVYVEKPCSHTAQEGEWAVQAARKNNRVVQMGSQRRSWPVVQEAIDRIHKGELGQVLYARCWYNNRRAAIGNGTVHSPPEWVNWDVWQGPSTRVDYKDNIVHYNWHWHWHWGNGELGNNGIHGIDVARWGLQVHFPTRVTAGGGHYRHQDSQETPDTMMTTFEFPENKMITWEGLSWSPMGPHDSSFGISFHGTDGSLIIRGADYVIFDMQGKQVDAKKGEAGDATHLENFLQCIKTNERPNADIEYAHESTLLCHLGNIAYRCNETLLTDPRNGHITSSDKARGLWSKEYEPGWEPKV